MIAGVSSYGLFVEVDGTAASGVLLSRNVSIPYLLRQFGGAKAGLG